MAKMSIKNNLNNTGSTRQQEKSTPGLLLLLWFKGLDTQIWHGMVGKPDQGYVDQYLPLLRLWIDSN